MLLPNDLKGNYMAILKINDLESHLQDMVLFPTFNLEIPAAHITAIYSSLNVRHVLLNMLIGKMATGNGTIHVKGYNPVDRSAYFSEMGVSFFDDGLYDRLTVMDHLKYYKKLYTSHLTCEEALSLTQLKPIKQAKVRRLTFSEQKRLHYARLLFQDPALFVFEEPDLNVDLETKRVFFNVTRMLQEKGRSILVLTGNMESAITVADQVYRLDENGLSKIDVETETEKEEEIMGVDEQSIHFDKIPTKVNEKIILFDPPEIDYIESNEGQSHLHIKGEAFPCVFTLSELEERLKPFGFFRCHRSYIVNLQKVREVITWTRNSYNLILEDEDKSSIPLSKAKMAQLKDMLGLK